MKASFVGAEPEKNEEIVQCCVYLETKIQNLHLI